MPPKVSPCMLSRLFERFDFTCYDLAVFQSHQVAAVVGRKDFCIDDGIGCSIDGCFVQVCLRRSDGIADVLIDAVDEGQAQRFRLRFNSHFLLSFLFRFPEDPKALP